MADYLLFQKAQRKSFSMNSAETTKDDTARAFGLALSESPLRVPETQPVFQPRRFLHGHYKVKLTANSCIALCSSKKAVSFSSARTIKRPAGSRSAATTQHCRPFRSVLGIEPNSSRLC